MVEARAETGGTRVGGRTAGEKIKMDTEAGRGEKLSTGLGISGARRSRVRNSDPTLRLQLHTLGICLPAENNL
jgi:hypothetical protein